MRCARCGRPLTVPAFAIQARHGQIAWGPKCARLAELVQHKQRAPKMRIRHAQADERQADWLMEIAACLQ